MKTLTIDINGDCNINCEFCYQDLDGSSLSQNQILEIAQEKQDFDNIEIGGGEPFMHKKLVEIIKDLTGNERKIHISTNATFIPKNILDLEESVRDKVAMQVSLHAGNKELYKSVTGKDFFDKVIENTKILKDFYKVGLNAVIYPKNFSQVKDILQTSYDLDIPIRVNPVFPIGNGRNVEKLSKEQIDRLRGILLLEKISHQGNIHNPLIQDIHCPALSKAYGIEGNKTCSLNLGKKEYFDSKGNALGCEFYRRNE